MENVNDQKVVLSSKYMSEYDDFTICLEDLEKDAKGYVYVPDDETVYEVVCTITVDVGEDPERDMDEALREKAGDAAADYDFSAEFITVTDEKFVAVEIVSTYKTGVSPDNIDYDCEYYC